MPQSERGYQYERGKGSFPRDLMDKDEGVQSLYQPPREGTQGVLGGNNARLQTFSISLYDQATPG